MRWAPFLIFAYLFTLGQTSLGRMLMLDRLTIGPVGPDILVLLAVFVAMYVRTAVDGMMAGWVLGMLIDLTTGGGATATTRVGPMAIYFALTAWLVFQVREALYRERALPQMLLAGVFCLITHTLWVGTQMFLAPRDIVWGQFGRLLLQVLLSSVYTGLLMPLVHFFLMPCRNWLLTNPPTRSRRTRR
ncbi:MAG: rod shape-determining protein MreD [Phycisphaerae bacterium]|nr:rod shape-determining protein MreD [Phycisphaerae bacterium]